MSDRKTAVRKAAAAIIEKAEDCFQLAKDERASAEQHRDQAAKLTKLGNSLESDAVDLSGEIDVTTDLPRK